jgi:hypothetical protein
MPGYYALYAGGDFEGTRLSYRLLDKVALADIPDTLEPLFADFARRRNTGEGFGDFCNRVGAEHLRKLVQEKCSTSAAGRLKVRRFARTDLHTGLRRPRIGKRRAQGAGACNKCRSCSLFAINI